jgi:hypothetical protein
MGLNRLFRSNAYGSGILKRWRTHCDQQPNTAWRLCKVHTDIRRISSPCYSSNYLTWPLSDECASVLFRPLNWYKDSKVYRGENMGLAKAHPLQFQLTNIHVAATTSQLFIAMFPPLFLLRTQVARHDNIACRSGFVWQALRMLFRYWTSDGPVHIFMNQSVQPGFNHLIEMRRRENGPHRCDVVCLFVANRKHW